MKRKIYKAYLISVIALLVVGLILRDEQVLAPTISFAMLVIGADNIVQCVNGYKDQSGLHWSSRLILLFVAVLGMTFWDRSIGQVSTQDSVIVNVEGIFSLVALNCLWP